MLIKSNLGYKNFLKNRFTNRFLTSKNIGTLKQNNFIKNVQFINLYLTHSIYIGKNFFLHWQLSLKNNEKSNRRLYILNANRLNIKILLGIK